MARAIQSTTRRARRSAWSSLPIRQETSGPRLVPRLGGDGWSSGSGAASRRHALPLCATARESTHELRPYRHARTGNALAEATAKSAAPRRKRDSWRAKPAAHPGRLSERADRVFLSPTSERSVSSLPLSVDFPVVTPYARARRADVGKYRRLQAIIAQPWSAVYLVRCSKSWCASASVNLVTGAGAVIGDALVRTTASRNHIHRVHILGKRSTSGGAAPVQVQLELGGKNPAVVIDHSDLTMRRGNRGGGVSVQRQRCTAISRVIVAGRRRMPWLNASCAPSSSQVATCGTGTTMGRGEPDQLSHRRRLCASGFDSDAASHGCGALTEAPERDGFYYAPPCSTGSPDSRWPSRRSSSGAADSARADLDERLPSPTARVTVWRHRCLRHGFATCRNSPAGTGGMFTSSRNREPGYVPFGA